VRDVLSSYDWFPVADYISVDTVLPFGEHEYSHCFLQEVAGPAVSVKLCFQADQHDLEALAHSTTSRAWRNDPLAGVDVELPCRSHRF